MADTWSEYLFGSPERRQADIEYQQRQFDAARSSPEYQALRRMAYKGDPDFDPRIDMMHVPTPDGGAVLDTLYPRRSSQAFDDEKAAYDYAMQMGMRLRDTALRGAQELVAGNPLKAAGYGMRAPLAALYPPAASGTPGSPDDWRENARRQGVSEGYIQAFDIGTDPETWVTAPVRGPMAFVVPALPMAAARAAGRVDRYGDVIRRLRSAQPAPRLGLPAPSY